MYLGMSASVNSLSRMSVASNHRELSRLRGFPLYTYHYMVNHPVGAHFFSMDVFVHFLVSPTSTLHGSSVRQLAPILRFLRGVPEDIFRGAFELYQGCTIVHSRDELVQGLYSDLSDDDMLQTLFSESDFLTHVYSRTPFCRVSSYYAQFEPDHLGDSFELFLSLA